MRYNLQIHWVFEEHLRNLSIMDTSNNGIYYAAWATKKIKKSRRDLRPQELTLIELVSLMSLLTSKASPLSFHGLCCKTVPSPPQLYKVREGRSPSPIWNKKTKLTRKLISLILCCYSMTTSYYELFEKNYVNTME